VKFNGRGGMRRWALAGRLIGIGWYIGLCIVFGVIGGIWVDNKLDTDVIWIISV
jgi:hypothetical protein